MPTSGTIEVLKDLSHLRFAASTVQFFTYVFHCVFESVSSAMIVRQIRSGKSLHDLEHVGLGHPRDCWTCRLALVVECLQD
jgi:hypothetical protein